MDEFNKDPFNEEKPDRDPKPQYQQPYQQQYQQPYQQPYQQNYNYNQQNINQQGYVPPQQGGYGYQQYTPYPQQPSQGMAIASLVIGIVSIVFAAVTAFLPFFAIVPIIGIILGALHKGKHLPVGKGVSTAGIITSIVGLILPVVIFILCIVLIFSFGNDPVFSGMMRESIDALKETSPEEYELLYETYSELFPGWFSEGFRFFFK